MNQNFIVCTTINAPTEAVRKFDNIKDWTLIVVGDLKTPSDFKLKNGIYLSPHDQEKKYKDMSDILGWNTIQRRNIGFLYAYEQNADLIATVDDDNIPTEDWGKNLWFNFHGEVDFYETSQLAFDPMWPTEYRHLWHRGFPIQLLSNRTATLTKQGVKVDIQANFWDGAPDIDAICRMEHAPECSFHQTSFPFASNKISPFNSQNTIIKREVLPHYFMFPFVGRMDDIFASYYVQSKGFKVIYDKPTVYQKRNEHDITQDFENEIIGYRHCIDIVKNPSRMMECIPTRSVMAFNIYQSYFN